MQKTTQVSIGGRAFTCDQDAYDIIHRYVERCGRKLAKNPDKDEIVGDIERSVADHLKEGLKVEVVNVALAEETVKAIGEVDSDEEDDEKKSESGDYSIGDKLREGWQRIKNIEPDRSRKILFGTSAGIGKEFDVDPFWVRLAFILLALGRGSGVFIYIILTIIFYNKEKSAQTASALMREAGKAVQSPSYEKGLRKFFKIVAKIILFCIGAVSLVMFMAAATLLSSGIVLLITNPSRISVFGAYHDWLQVVWMVSLGLATILPPLVIFIATVRWRKAFKTMAVLSFLWLAVVVVAVASSVANVPRLRTWAIDHDLHTPYIYVTKLDNKPVDVCFSPNGDCSILTTLATRSNSVCTYPVYDRTKVEGMYGLRYQSIDQDWKMATMSLPQPVTDKAVCDAVDKIMADNPYSEVIFTNRPQDDVFMESVDHDGTYVDTPTYQLDYLITNR